MKSTQCAKALGFTPIELVITVTIVAIFITTIAVPAMRHLILTQYVRSPAASNLQAALFYAHEASDQARRQRSGRSGRAGAWTNGWTAKLADGTILRKPKRAFERALLDSRLDDHLSSQRTGHRDAGTALVFQTADSDGHCTLRRRRLERTPERLSMTWMATPPTAAIERDMRFVRPGSASLRQHLPPAQRSRLDDDRGTNHAFRARRWAAWNDRVAILAASAPNWSRTSVAKRACAHPGHRRPGHERSNRIAGEEPGLRDRGCWRRQISVGLFGAGWCTFRSRRLGQ